LKHRAPQPEFAIPDEPFTLTTRAAIDGDRVAKEKARLEADRQQAEKYQALLSIAIQQTAESLTKANTPR
jgi:hypothetical protein